jgi:hypothetical protein
MRYCLISQVLWVVGRPNWRPRAREAVAHLHMIDDPLAMAIAKQFPDKISCKEKDWGLRTEIVTSPGGLACHSERSEESRCLRVRQGSGIGILSPQSSVRSPRHCSQGPRREAGRDRKCDRGGPDGYRDTGDLDRPTGQRSDQLDQREKRKKDSGNLDVTPHTNLLAQANA